MHSLLLIESQFGSWRYTSGIKYLQDVTDIAYEYLV